MGKERKQSVYIMRREYKVYGAEDRELGPRICAFPRKHCLKVFNNRLRSLDWVLRVIWGQWRDGGHRSREENKVATTEGLD